MMARASGRLLAEHLPSLADDSFADQAVIVIAFDRVFDAPVESVWEWLIDPVRTTHWYGWWRETGEEGALELMTIAGPGARRVDIQLVECDPGRLLRLKFVHGKMSWFASLTLDSDPTTADAPTTLTCVQSFGSAEVLERIGPAWDYYLDRLVAAHSGNDVDTLQFEPDYYPNLVPHYQGLVREAIADAHAMRDHRLDDAL